MECQQVSQIINEDGSISQVMGSAETVTISLEDAAQIILQEQVMDGTLQIPPGTYHILTQDSVPDNRLIVTGADGMPVIMQSEDGLNDFTVQTAEHTNLSEVVNTVVSEGSTMDLIRVDQSEEMHVTDNMDETAETPMELPSDLGQPDCTEAQMVNGCTNESQPPMEENLIETAAHDAAIARDDGEGGIEEAALAPPPSRKPDLTSPIPVTESTEVTINGKKCVMMLNPDSGLMCAYPLLPPEGRRKRGRPRKQIKTEDVTMELNTLEQNVPVCDIDTKPVNVDSSPSKQENDVTQQWLNVETPTVVPDGANSQKNGNNNGELMTETDQTNAAEGLLELSAVGPDGVRRSGRVRQRAKVLDDYEVLEISSEDEGAAVPDDEVTPLGLKKRRTMPKENNTLTPYLLGTGVKRGRGRPRRYPPSSQNNLHTQIPAVIIPTSNGQTLMMAPVQGIQNLQALQQQFKQLPALIQKPSENGGAGGEAEGGGIAAAIAAAVATGENNQILTVSVNSNEATESETNATIINSAKDEAQTITENNQMKESNGKMEMQSLGTQNNHSKEENVGDEAKSTSISEVTTNSNQPTIIQIPESLLPMFLPKKDPIKLGLKTYEHDLDHLRCSKCQFQSYYPQQLQEHLLTEHTESVEKCKCCTYVSLDKTELLNHFKENHPRCICQVCDFTSEYSYIIRRHMMRHNATGSTCELCGKTYKDQYILKMHVKMVHLPAEVLYECTVCAKKFTRKAHLKRHLRIHDPEKPYKCPSCDYRGCERSDISKHILIHDDPKHICEECGKAFRHIKNKELHVKRHKGQRDYKCGVCDFFGYTFTDIRKHIERKHSDVKTLVCDKCGQAFRNETSLIEHQKQKCDVTMIEQALTIATSSGTSEARIQIPSSLQIDGQHLTIGDQHIPIDGNQMNITVEQVSLTEQHNDGTLSLDTETLTDREEIAVAAQTEDLEEEEEEEEEEMLEEEEETNITGTEPTQTTVTTTTVTTTPQIIEMVSTELAAANPTDEDVNKVSMTVPLVDHVKEVTVLAEENIPIAESSETTISDAGANLVIS